MAKKTITVYEALQEKKLLEKRIAGLDTKQILFVTYAGETDETISGLPMDKVKSSLTGNYNSITHLVKNIAAYTAGINQSNAVTMVKIGELSYTVAEAIARYKAIDIEKAFVADLVRQYNSTKSAVEKHNLEIRDTTKIASYLNGVFGESKRDTDQINAATETYLKKNLWIIIDPNELGDNLQKKCDELNLFKEKFHFVLTQSNAVTSIELELED